MIIGFFSWWYGTGWHLMAERIRGRIQGTMAAFSVPSLLRTMFAPWRRIVSPPGTTIGDHMRAALDNLVSRCVGFAVRLIVLIAGSFIMLLTAIVGGIQLVLWPLIPPAIIALIIGGLL